MAPWELTRRKVGTAKTGLDAAASDGLSLGNELRGLLKMAYTQELVPEQQEVRLVPVACLFLPCSG